MQEDNEDWQAVRKALLKMDGVADGTMMRRPALRWSGNVFAFLAKLNGPGMAAKIGQADPASVGVSAWRPLQPFKNKAPMKDWVIVAPEDRALWVEIAKLALQEQERQHA